MDRPPMLKEKNTSFRCFGDENKFFVEMEIRECLRLADMCSLGPPPSG